MKVKDLIKWLQEKNPEADIYVGEADGTVCHEFRGLESFLNKEGKEQTILINYSKKKNEKRKVLYQYERRNEKMRTLEDMITIENNYFSQCGGSLNIKEADKNQNTISRCKIRAFKNKYGKCFLGKINRRENEPVLREYRCGKIYNFDCNFVIPEYDAELEKMIKEYSNKPYSGESIKDINRILNRITALGGLNILWV